MYGVFRPPWRRLPQGQIASAGGVFTRLGTPNPVTLTAATFSFTGASLNVVVGRNITLTPATFAFTGSNLTALVARSITLTAGSFSLTGSNLTAAFTGNYNIVLTPATFSFAGQPLNVTKGGTSSPTGHGGKRKLPYGWWEALVEPENEIALAQEAIQEAQVEVRKTGHISASTLFGLRQALQSFDLETATANLDDINRKQAEKRLAALAAELKDVRAEYLRAIEDEDEAAVEMLLLSM